MKRVDDMPEDELRSEYRREDFGVMVRGKYAERAREASNLVVLDPDVAEAFPDSRTVNEALRRLLKLARTVTRPPAQASSGH